MEMLGLALTALAYFVGSVVFFLFSGSRNFTRRESAWLLAAAICGGVIGAKITRLLFAASSGADPMILAAHPEGRTIIGGIIFGWLSVEFAKKRLSIERSTGDAFALALCAGEAVGRLGCFFNGCCYGAPAAVPWAVYQAGAWRHPAQIYSALAAVVIFLILWFLRYRVKFEGDLFRIYLFVYSITRFALEFLRERSEVHFGLSIAQWVCLEIGAAMAIAIALPYLSQKQFKEQAVEDDH